MNEKELRAKAREVLAESLKNQSSEEKTRIAIEILRLPPHPSDE